MFISAESFPFSEILSESFPSLVAKRTPIGALKLRTDGSNGIDSLKWTFLSEKKFLGRKRWEGTKFSGYRRPRIEGSGTQNSGLSDYAFECNFVAILPILEDGLPSEN